MGKTKWYCPECKLTHRTSDSGKNSIALDYFVSKLETFDLIEENENLDTEAPLELSNSLADRSRKAVDDKGEAKEKLRRSGSSPSSTKAGILAHKRSRPLPPIIVDDPTDMVAIRRARNILAARKSRQKKMVRVEELENEIAKLEEERGAPIEFDEPHLNTRRSTRQNLFLPELDSILADEIECSDETTGDENGYDDDLSSLGASSGSSEDLVIKLQQA